jgi:hypothetical protein
MDNRVYSFSEERENSLGLAVFGLMETLSNPQNGLLDRLQP